MAIYEYVHMVEQYKNAHFFIHLFRLAILLFNNEVLKCTQLFFADSWFSMSAVVKMQINFKIYFVIQQLNIRTYTELIFRYPNAIFKTNVNQIS